MPGGGAEGREWVRRWWRGEGGSGGAFLDLLTYPAELLYRAASSTRNRLYDAGVLRAAEASLPVISIGNLTVGGTGKTPVSAWVASRLRSWGRHPALLLRGYGADEIAVHREVNPGAPVIAAARRIEGVPAALREGADCLVLDDGFQHRGIGRQLDIVLVAAEQWPAPRRMLPRGPWREPVSSLRRADFVLVTRKTAEAAAAVQVLAEARRQAGGLSGGVAFLRLGELAPILGSSGYALPGPGEEVVAVSSLAEPAAFETQLHAAGFGVLPARFPDHHAFTPRDIREILDLFGDRALVMTRKEAVKLRSLLPRDARAFMVGQEVVFESGENDLERALRTAIGG